MDKEFEAIAAAKDALFHSLADPLFWIGLALGVALILFGVIIRRGTAGGRRCSVGGAALLCILAAAFCQTRVDKDRGFLVDQQRRADARFREISRLKGKSEALKMQYMYMPTKNFLTAVTLNNPSIGADYVWLTSLQYVSNSFRRGDKFELLSNFYHTMVDLDPHWVDAQCTGGKVLSALIDEREKAEECFLYANRQNPDSWKILHELGLLYVMPPSNPKKMKEFSRRAANYFELTRQHKNCPKEMFKMLDDRVARLRLESGKEYYQQAESLLFKNATDPESTDQLRDISKRDWLKARSMAQAAALSEVAEDIRKKTGGYPKTLAEIVGKMAQPEAFATDAYKQPFDYDPETGAVSSHGANALRSIQAGGIVNEIIRIFKEDHTDRAPKDLIELRDYVRSAKKSPFSPPNVMVLEAVGLELDPSIGPLGPWKYDTEKGVIVLAPEADAKELYSHVKDYFK